MSDTVPILEQLFALRDPSYREFHCKLVPTVDPKRIIGVRTPQLRALARSLSGTPQAQEFLEVLPHEYYEENNLHGLLICGLREYDRTVEELKRFLPCVDNWATCDLLSPRAFQKRPPQLVGQLEAWIASSHPYTIRFGLGMLLSHYLDEGFWPGCLELAAGVRSQEYYVNMMVAWLFATALAKQYEATLPYLEGRRLDPWTHNQTIQKAVESRRVPPAHKEYLRSLRWK